MKLSSFFKRFFCCRCDNNTVEVSLMARSSTVTKEALRKLNLLSPISHGHSYQGGASTVISALPVSQIFDLEDTEIEQDTECQAFSVNLAGCLPPSNSEKPTLVLDLDNTLIFSTTKELANFDHKININYNGRSQTVWIIERPFLQHFLESLSDKYEIVLFTAGIRQYGIKVIKKIDRNRCIDYFLDRRFCTLIGKNSRNQDLFSKDIRILGRSSRRTLLVDDREYSFCFSQKNGILVPMFNGDFNDRCLLDLLKYLEECSVLEDLSSRAPFQCK